MKAVMFEDVSRMLRGVDLSIVDAIAGAINLYVENGESALFDWMLAMYVKHSDITEKTVHRC